MGYIVARTFRSTTTQPEWDIMASHANKPEATTMRQYRQGSGPNYTVRTFTEEAFDAMAYGLHSADWVYVNNKRIARCADGIRR